MKRRHDIPAETIRLQGEAADPRNSVWVSANAGSGKTHVLSQRVIRLLLGGTDPSKILCLTYTRAAAANMANRIFGTLSDWTTLPDNELAERIAAIEGRWPEAGMLRRARRLFAEALETPGGLKIQTIHAFCEAVLHQFPLEANIVAHFEMLDTRMEEALFDQARREMISGVMAADSPGLAEAFAAVLDVGGEFGLDTLLSEIVRKRDALRGFIVNAGLDQSYEPLFAEFGYGAADTAGSIASEVWPVPGFPPAYLSTLDLVSYQVGASRTIDSLIAPAGRAFAETDSVRRLGLLKAAFFKANGDPYGPTWLFSKALLAQMPDLVDRYAEATQAITAAADRLAQFRMLEGTRAALTIADFLIGRYERLKSGRGFLDFNDLITRTVNLLARPDAGPWVQYKLDKGIDHILLDEAQDTSPDQWAVVRSLAEEFFAGVGARDHIRRTVFAVGDEKQSIYSFQGAAPESFDENRHLFSARVRDAGARFERVDLKWSFRSTEDVLGAVDKVFLREDMRRGVTHDPLIEHKAIRAGVPGYVEVWPSLGATVVQEPDDWTVPVDHAKAPAVRLAENVATTIKGWLTSGERLDGRRLIAGDVMVLVRKRDSFVHALSRSLKNRGIPVAGADRLVLPAHIAVKDLTALGKYLLQPHDDLSLAAVLKSPIFALTEEQLFVLAWNRPKGQSLGEALARQAVGDLLLADVVATLDAWATEAAFKPVFEFYSGVLAGAPGRDGVRKRMMARLGPEAGEILDEFLSFCLAEERVGLPGLEAFLASLETAGPEIKREMDQGRDEVRIMTVHAAKGLEAPVVFLVDGGSAPFSEQHLPRLVSFESQSRRWPGKGFLWRASAEVANTVSRGVAQRLRAAAEDEYHRLLYVGMTRAEDRLIVCGYYGKLAPSPATWHRVVEAALSGLPESVSVANPFTGETVQRYRVTSGTAAAGEDAAPSPTSVRDEPPRHLLRPLPADTGLPRPLSPSGASTLIDETSEPQPSSRSPVLDGDDEPGPAIRRGLAVHKLLQVLPDMEPARRPAAMQRYLSRVGSDWAAEEREEIEQSVVAILDRPDFSALFAPGSRAEVAVMGSLDVRGKTRSLSGKIDRLAVTADEVLILDYKTNRPAPAGLDGVSPGYVTQLALYRALLQPLYPRHAVRAALLFTAGPHLIAVPEAAMDEALARLTRA